MPTQINIVEVIRLDVVQGLSTFDLVPKQDQHRQTTELYMHDILNNPLVPVVIYLNNFIHS
jgi:hypothetical protein